MFSLFIALLVFSKSLATKCLFLNDESCMVKPTLIDMSPNEFKYYQFMISLNNVLEVVMSYLQKICVSKETKDINAKAFNMITNKDEVKAMNDSTYFMWL